jgi:hypothetical protein
MSNLNLGILYKDNKIVNHRSILKVFINPILRYFGYCIATNCKNEKLGKIVIISQEKIKPIKWNLYDYNDFDKIIKKRILF